MPYKPKFLGHINMYVRNAQRSKEWYEDLLGLHTYIFRPGVAAFMSADLDVSHEIALTEIGDDAPLQQQGQVGLNHMAWYMESLDDLKELYYRIKEKNVQVERVADHGLSIGIYIRDPDGNGIEVSYELPRAEWRRVQGQTTTEKGRLPGPWDAELATQAADEK
jgi:catechol 2,3-dioxygenase